MNGTVWSIRPFKLVLTHFYQFIELNTLTLHVLPCFHCLCADCFLGLDCGFSMGQTFHLSSLLYLAWLYVLTLLAPVTLYGTAGIALPLDWIPCWTHIC